MLEIFTVSELSNKLKVGEETIRRWIRAGKLNAIPNIKPYLVNEEELEDFIRGRVKKNLPEENAPT